MKIYSRTLEKLKIVEDFFDKMISEHQITNSNVSMSKTKSVERVRFYGVRKSLNKFLFGGIYCSSGMGVKR